MADVMNEQDATIDPDMEPLGELAEVESDYPDFGDDIGPETDEYRRIIAEKQLLEFQSELQHDDDDDDDEDDEDGSELISLGKDLTHLILKQDHHKRPLWITPDCRIFVETHSELYQEAYDLLIAIATPICRPSNIHEYAITPSSLQAAVSVGITVEQMLDALDKLSKVSLDPSVEEYFREHTKYFGKVSLYLRKNRCYLRTTEPDIARRLQNDSELETCLAPKKEPNPPKKRRLMDGNGYQQISTQADGLLGSPNPTQSTTTSQAGGDDDESEEAVEEQQEEEQEEEVDKGDSLRYFEFLIGEGNVERVKNILRKLNFPLIEEYDYIGNKGSDTIDIDLKPQTSLRPYQIKSLAKMFANHVARSGIIVLPCGAGKTLVGVAATNAVKQSTVVLCNSAIAVDQWKAQYEAWTTIDPKKIFRFTSDHHDKLPEGEGIILITTYSMITYSQKRKESAAALMESVRKRAWGLMVLDEVHIVPALTFKSVTERLKAHCKLGLTATLVREDNKISDLDYIIGPKLYEANWLDLVKEGHIAHVSCFEVWCPMTPEFYDRYLTTDREEERQLLCVSNPTKFMACEYLIRHHLQLRHKIIVFSDNLFALRKYAETLGHDYMLGQTTHKARMELFHKFKMAESCCLFLSKVGDVAVDLPSANVVIQISSHGASRRQEAQRLGRILRKKMGAPQSENNAYFYTLVSQDTREMYYSTKRQQFLVDQGYSFRVVANLLKGNTQILHFSTIEEQRRLLEEVKGSKDLDDELMDDNSVPIRGQRGLKQRKIKQVGGLSSRTGAGAVQYTELTRNRYGHPRDRPRK
eukprot:TRINITY_DN4274_c0_g1_i1.p1 TRINITY_DN4274_c0_g1~~TRINITY_DN4274_c0_g1_i1.p1  ORF type:complete len:811 (-),score=199.36 TRINITY_DN4274_c0_g1_i1:136-2568(-)